MSDAKFTTHLKYELVYPDGEGMRSSAVVAKLDEQGRLYSICIDVECGPSGIESVLEILKDLSSRQRIPVADED